MNRNLVRIIMLGLCAFLSACNSVGGPYEREGDHIVFVTSDEGQGRRAEVVQGADVVSFKSVGGVYGKDKNRAYCGPKPIPGAQPDSFVTLSRLYAKDKSRVYYGPKPIPDADPESFAVSNDTNYSQDKNDIFLLGDHLHVCDRQSFRRLTDRWAVDNRCAYHGGDKLPGAHPASFVVLNFTYAKDDAQAYSNLSPYVIAGADAASFALSGGMCEVCARDRQRCYSFGEVKACR